MLLIQKPKSRYRGRQSKRPEITPHQAKQKAIRLLRENRLSPMAVQVTEALATGGVLTSGQLYHVTTVSPRTLQKYHKQYLLDRLPILADELMALDLADDPAKLRLYTLGPVGLEVARIRHEHVPTGYTGYGTHRIIHDVLTNEVVLRLAALAVERGYEPLWYSKYEATVHDERGKPALEPDAMLAVRRDGVYRYFVVEFHNEDKRTRARSKVDRYERVYRDGRWRNELETDEMPAVLAVFTHKIVGKGYREAISSRSMRPRCVFLGKSWRDVIAGDDMARWFNFNQGKMVDILED